MAKIKLPSVTVYNWNTCPISKCLLKCKYDVLIGSLSRKKKKKIVALHFSHGLVQCGKKPWGLLFLLQLCSPSAAYLYLACLWAPIALHSGIQFTIISPLQKGSTLAVVQASWLPSMDIWKCAMKQPPVHMVSLRYSDFKWSPQWGQGMMP